MPSTKQELFLTPVNPAFQHRVVIKANEALPPKIQAQALEKMQTYLTNKRCGEVRMEPIVGSPERMMLTCSILSAEESMSIKRPIDYVRDQAYTIRTALRTIYRMTHCKGPYLRVEHQ